MTDRHELLCARLHTVLGTVPGFTNNYRNRGDIDETKKPAIAMFDADEMAEEAVFVRGRKLALPNLVGLRPQVFMLLRNVEPQNINIGPMLSTHRRNILVAIHSDAELATLVTENGQIRYEGMATDLASGRSMKGEAQLHFAFIYPLMIRELEA